MVRSNVLPDKTFALPTSGGVAADAVRMPRPVRMPPAARPVTKRRRDVDALRPVKAMEEIGMDASEENAAVKSEAAASRSLVMVGLRRLGFSPRVAAQLRVALGLLRCQEHCLRQMRRQMLRAKLALIPRHSGRQGADRRFVGGVAAERLVERAF